MRRSQFDLPHANDARVLVGYCADRMTDLYLYLYTIFDQRRLDIIDQVEHGRSPQQVTHLPPVWDLLLPLA